MMDIDAIAECIALDSPDYASLMVLRILEAGKKLEQFPEAGAALQGVGSDSYRQVVVGAYRIIYRVDLDVVRVARVYHGARLLNPSDLDR
jgi:toxin ParE1/3/4